MCPESVNNYRRYLIDEEVTVIQREKVPNDHHLGSIHHPVPQTRIQTHNDSTRY
ncbi:unnamed protein product [Toxocara canis]|uniref:Uncharacterized protein n=1 Tax=Toxocara canis TaxID=6265 RepID=A0A183U958_TOXCA|nr:unnamed protein product [Toxocara canis]